MGVTKDLVGKIADKVNFTNSSTAGDIVGPGTHIAGILAASGKNRIGISGIPSNTLLLKVKVADDYSFCEAENLARGIY